MKPWIQFKIGLVWGICLLVSAHTLQAQKLERERKVSDRFPVNANTTLTIANKFGKVHINTNNSREILVEAVITAKANTPEAVAKTLERVQIDITRGDNLKFVTKIDEKAENSWSNGVSMFNSKDKVKVKDKKSQEFEINYTISMPENVPLTLSNKFGDAYVGNHKGRLDVQVGYGNLKLQRVEGAQKKYVKVSFGKGELDFIQQGDVVVSYSSMNMERAGAINLTSSFSDVTLKEAQSIQLANKYGSLTIDKVGSMEGRTSFSKFNLGSLEKSMDITTKYDSPFNIKSVSSNFESIDIEGQFAKTEVGFAPGASFSFDVDVNFANFKNYLNNSNLSKEIKTHTSASYEGTVGNGGNAQVNINSKYGNITFK